MLAQRKGFSKAYAISCLLHLVGWVSYIYGFIPKSIESYYYYNLDRLFIISIMVITHMMVVDDHIKRVIKSGIAMYTTYFIVCNVAFFFNTDLSIKVGIVIFTTLAIATTLRMVYDPSRSENMER